MKLLLDTHMLIWAVDGLAQLGAHAVAELQDPTNELLLSAGSIWELTIKVGSKNWSYLRRTASGYYKPSRTSVSQSFRSLPVLLAVPLNV